MTSSISVGERKRGKAAGIFTTFSSLCYAADTDLTALDYESLSKLKQEIDKEYYSRPESEPFTLGAGLYTVGEDILPGKYYIADPVKDLEKDDVYNNMQIDYNTFIEDEKGNEIAFYDVYGEFADELFFSDTFDEKCKVELSALI